MTPPTISTGTPVPVLAAQLHRDVVTYPGIATEVLLGRLTGGHDDKRAALVQLVDAGLIRRERDGHKLRHYAAQLKGKK